MFVKRPVGTHFGSTSLLSALDETFSLIVACYRYNLDPSETFLQNLIYHCYTSPIEDLSPRRLALLLMVLSIGSLVDLNRPLGSLYGEAYHHLARASVCEIPLMEEPDFDELHALVCLFVIPSKNQALTQLFSLSFS